MTTAISGAGTSETRWRPWLDAQTWPTLDVGRFGGRRVVVLAAHPDDEVLGAGGLLSALAAEGSEIVAVWATDGEASHPGSNAMSPDQLAERRRRESQRALARLGVVPVLSLLLGLPDGGLEAQAMVLRTVLRNLLRDDDVVLAPWREDGHPDHEAVGSAAAEIGVTLLEYPVWMWHWAAPEDSRVPWSRLHTVPVPDLSAKAAAIDTFDTQVRPIGPQPEDAAILPADVVAHFLRPFDVVLA